jgi:hypothetical protein
MTAARLPRTLIALLALAGALAGTLWASTARSEAARVSCPTFQVLHNDRIGNLVLPKGKYKMTVIDGSRLSCASASSQFRNFLWDYDGKLPRPWTYKAIAKGDGKFFQRTNKQVGFRVKRGTAPAPDPGPTPGPTPKPGKYQRCPGTFRVLNNDRIGQLILPRGPYYIYSTVNPALSCPKASARFTKFLNYTTGALPKPWKLNAAKASFTNTRKGLGFRVKQAR